MPDRESIDRFDASAALERVRRLVVHCRESCRQIAAAAAARPIRSVAVIGAGIMGSAIAVEHAKRAIPVVLVDKSAEALHRAAMLAAVELEAAERCGWRNPDSPAISFTKHVAEIEGCDLVIESIVEKRQVKQALYDALRPHLARDTILATNTSTIPMQHLSAGTGAPSSFCGLHFCHPVSQRPLVEVIPGPATSAETVSTLVAHTDRLKKLALIVNDGPGFVVNRLLHSYVDAALRLFISGSAMETIDAAMVEFGMPLGPLASLDEIGLDTALQSGVVLADGFAGSSLGSQLLVRLVKAGHCGRKAGSGFYVYPARHPNPSVGEIAGSLGLADFQREEKTACESASITECLLRPVILEARRLVTEKKASSFEQVNLATIFGLGFPLWRGDMIQ